ncbi:Integrin beta-PS [Acropora cervicornis]|uniref:Integrin beta n=1 Tax=Acropora cervicornis TaxID=6130 RepID=A0AAD9R0A4_ACRCE|nr:Integrin beta-PS [Acropora cervicornis]
MRTFWVTLCALFLGICGVSSRDCRFIESCGECIQNIDPPCSWCEDVNKPLDTNVKVKPQNITLSLRPGQPATVKVDVKMPGNYPVDLYYLMDLSGSMVEDLKRFPTLGDSIAFVDKPLAPYIETQPGSNPNMVPAFGFVNQLSLTENISEFESVINRVNISGNIDNPEGTLDALMQIAVCDKEIGWRDKQSARRIVIVITDATFHFAGDGLLGGVVKPNDGYCYTDYPSPGFLKKRLIDEQVSPIFAINQSKVDELVTFFGSESGAVSESLREDSSNLLQLIRQAYEKIAKTQTIRDTAPEGVKVSFEVSVTVDDCNLKERAFSLITPFGNVEINLDFICSCQCEKEAKTEKSRAHCSGNGTLICGQCICDQGWDNTTETKECSGDGTCLCGDCVCKKNDLLPGEIINGKYCECSNMDCPRDRDTGLICGGPERGECVCGNCNCSGNWTGQSCSCTKRTDSCIKDGVLCNGFGTCECGNCVCNASTPYRGKYCDECPSCVGKCSQNKNCVQCLVFKSGQLSADQCKSRCKDFKIEEVDELSPEMGERCTFRDSDDCSFTFSYKENPGKDIKIFVQKEKVCPKEAEALAVILGVVGGVLGVGIALILIWKLLATIQGENPIFKQPTTTFQNPTYGGK